MENTSQHSTSLDSKLLEIEHLFQKRENKQALLAMDKLDQAGYSPHGLDRGFHALLLAERAFYGAEYESTLEHCHQAMEKLGITIYNHRIGRLQYVMYLAYSALGKLKDAEQSARDSLASYRRIKDNLGIFNGYNALAKIYYFRSDYAMAAEYIQEAVQYIQDDPTRESLLLGNLGRIYLLTGDMEKARENLEQAISIAKEHDLPLSLVRNHLSMGYLYLRLRHYYQSEMELEKADGLIREYGYKRERIIYLEYSGELSIEKQDFVSAKTNLEKAILIGEELAPRSTLVSQCLRRLAEAELELGHYNVAMKLSQKALDLAMDLGEKAEIGLAHRVISQIFSVKNETADARRHGLEGIEFLRDIGDAFELGRSIIRYGAIPPAGVSISDRKIYPLLQEAEEIFTVLGDEYNIARCHFEQGRLCHHFGKNGEALEFLKTAADGFRSIGDKSGVAAVSEFLDSLSKNAIKHALSENNEFKVFGNLITGEEYQHLKASKLDSLLSILVEKVSADRGVMINHSQGEVPEVNVAVGIDESEYEAISEGFAELLNDRLISDEPVLILDCTGSMDFSGIVPESNGGLASLIVLPLTIDSEIIGYIYLDRLKHKPSGTINPFSQKDINFAVGFADLAAFKAAGFQKEKLLEDNLRLKAQLLEKCVFPNIITQSRKFMETLARVRQVADSNMAISITGETGTGKDLLAKAIHYNSSRRDKRFISVNCAALPESLLESELFGYKKGAFTGADRDKSGLFEEADRGTFFLDEIADMPQSIQAKVLRLLENMEITRLGDTRPRKVDVRVISATNKNLKVEMGAKRFRSDLYYRLCALHFDIPSLKERKEDIPLLIAHFLEGSNCQIMADTMKYLIDYDWPGNVRELENETKKLILLANNEGPIMASLLSRRILGEDNNSVIQEPDETAFFSEEGFSLYDYMAEFEKRFIVKALREQRGIKKRAADSLNIPESTLRLKLKQYDIDPKRLDVN